MNKLAYGALQVVAGGVWKRVYEANLPRGSDCPCHHGNTDRPVPGNWNVRPAPDSNAYGEGWGEDNNGMG